MGKCCRARRCKRELLQARHAPQMVQRPKQTRLQQSVHVHSLQNGGKKQLKQPCWIHCLQAHDDRQQICQRDSTP